MPQTGITIIQLAVSAFFAILFLQSGIDKIIDWKGNLQFHTEHFANSPLNKFSKPMLVVMTVMEVLCGLLSAVGMFLIIITGQRTIAFYGVVLATIIFLSLFFGQRVSKDYKGAATIVSYLFLPSSGLFCYHEPTWKGERRGSNPRPLDPQSSALTN